jgi:hypothetical protein
VVVVRFVCVRMCECAFRGQSERDATKPNSRRRLNLESLTPTAPSHSLTTPICRRRSGRYARRLDGRTAFCARQRRLSECAAAAASAAHTDRAASWPAADTSAEPAGRPIPGERRLNSHGEPINWRAHLSSSSRSR